MARPDQASSGRRRGHGSVPQERGHLARTARVCRRGGREKRLCAEFPRKVGAWSQLCQRFTRTETTRREQSPLRAERLSGKSPRAGTARALGDSGIEAQALLTFWRWADAGPVTVLATEGRFSWLATEGLEDVTSGEAWRVRTRQL